MTPQEFSSSLSTSDRHSGGGDWVAGVFAGGSGSEDGLGRGYEWGAEADQERDLCLSERRDWAQHESLDMKPLAPDSIRGEFSPIATATPGTFICEHLPLLAQRSRKWSLVRSLTHSRNDHGESIHIMNTGRSNLPPGLDRNRPKPTDFPSMLSVAGSQLKGPGGLPASAVLPRLVTNVNKSQRPGQTGGLMGPRHDPWLINAAAECNGYGACPDCFYFSNKPEFHHTIQPVFQAPNLSLPDGLSLGRLDRRVDLLREVEDGQRELDRQLSVARLGRDREGALSLLTSGRVREAFDLQTEDPTRLDAYGRNVFGLSCCS